MVCKQQIKVNSVSVPCQIMSDCGWGSAGGKNWDFLSGVTSGYVRALCLCPKKQVVLQANFYRICCLLRTKRDRSHKINNYSLQFVHNPSCHILI